MTSIPNIRDISMPLTICGNQNDKLLRKKTTASDRLYMAAFDEKSNNNRLDEKFDETYDCFLSLVSRTAFDKEIIVETRKISLEQRTAPVVPPEKVLCSDKLPTFRNMHKTRNWGSAHSICANNNGSRRWRTDLIELFITFLANYFKVVTNYHNSLLHLLLVIVLCLTCCNALLVVETPFMGLSDSISSRNSESAIYSTTRKALKADMASIEMENAVPLKSLAGTPSSSLIPVNGYLEKLDYRDLSASSVLIKSPYGGTSTTKRSMPDNGYAASLTTAATPLLTTLRYLDKSAHQQQINFHHRNYELDLERDHALPTSAPNADILKSNSNPTYPNPNRHHNHERERHRHLLNSTPLPSLPNILKKNNGQSPTIPMYPGDIPSYSPPSRSFFTPPLPPEYQHPFADKSTLRGTNNEGIIANTGTFINRRPIPPPSLMPGHERIPYRPPDLFTTTGENPAAKIPGTSSLEVHAIPSSSVSADAERKKTLNTPSRGTTDQQSSGNDNKSYYDTIKPNQQEVIVQGNVNSQPTSEHSTRQEVLPSIRRILSGSNGNRGEIPEVLLKQVTSRPILNYHQPPSSPVVLVESTKQQNMGEEAVSSSNINKSKNVSIANEESDFSNSRDMSGVDDIEHKFSLKTKMSTKSSTEHLNENTVTHGNGINSTSTVDAATKDTTISAATTSASISATDGSVPGLSSSSPSSSSSSSSTSTSAAAATLSTWAVAWNIHVYLSVILFTILAVYSFYKMLIYNKLTHLFTQSYFVCIHFILIVICTSRIFYLCYDAYNIHSSFHIFVSEILLNLPATFLTISFSVLILFLFIKSLNHKNNRYSALIRPLTVVVGCGVHVVLCITLHYVESYTMQNQQYHLYQQQQQQLYRRQQQQQFQAYQQHASGNLLESQSNNAGVLHYTNATTPPRVLSLICQIIYIFICLSLGLLYLYLYRILKRILRSKSQNYIHGYQNLSYAIHITIATALLFVLLAALQIFGAISISTTRTLISQTNAEIDWLQWGYQFSLRLIEIAIITLISWVAGLKTSASSGTVGGMVASESRLGGAGTASGSGIGIFGSSTVGGGNREKHGYHHNHTNVAGFFLPCTSSSSQEQFDTDYPAVCNANTNLHTYTMRTGKLIYDDSFALNTLAGGQTSQLNARNNTEFQMQHPTYQRPYDTGSLHSTANPNVADYNTAQDNLSNNIGNHRYNHDHHQYSEYLTDGTDHYENPNFDLRSTSGTAHGGQAFGKNLATSSAANSNSGGSRSSALSQQQMLLLQHENCYSEPIQHDFTAASNYDFSILERPKFRNSDGHDNESIGFLAEQPPHVPPLKRLPAKGEKKTHATLERAAYENPERRSSNSNHSCASSSGAGRCYNGYNSFERGRIRKSGTLNNIGGGVGTTGTSTGVILHGRNPSTSSAASSNISTALQRPTGIQTLAANDRQQYHHLQQQQLHELRQNDTMDLQQQQQQQHNSDDDMMIPVSNVERTILINNEDGSCAANSRSGGIKTANNPKRANFAHTDQLLEQCNSLAHGPTHHQHHNHNHSNSGLVDSAISSSSGMSFSSASDSASSGSMLVADRGFVRFRALDDMNNAQGIGVHNASVRNQPRNNAAPGGANAVGALSAASKTPVQSVS